MSKLAVVGRGVTVGSRRRVDASQPGEDAEGGGWADRGRCGRAAAGQLQPLGASATVSASPLLCPSAGAGR